MIDIPIYWFQIPPNKELIQGLDNGTALVLLTVSFVLAKQRSDMI